jgi:hypothetical protein
MADHTPLDVGPKELMPTTYLGDGLYGEFDGYQFRLWTDRYGVVHEVFLDARVTSAFIDFVRQVAKKKITESADDEAQ